MPALSVFSADDAAPARRGEPSFLLAGGAQAPVVLQSSVSAIRETPTEKLT